MHLRRVLAQYVTYYGADRTHLSLGKDSRPRPGLSSRVAAARWSRCRGSAASIIATKGSPHEVLRMHSLYAAYKARGVEGLVSRKRGAASHRKVAPELRELAVKLVRGQYGDFGPTLAHEKLVEVARRHVEARRQRWIGGSLSVCSISDSSEHCIASAEDVLQ